eukprot:TRINITY_DN224_c2_g1_i2.p1 TRINITY_DN224_c2_g1~~TRINITY_DN224_c2_g1_i2.p1  ORF type:complete len:531 (+),score=44.75 TRINITY_DN224_c2_g1_i2:400-1992(+)
MTKMLSNCTKSQITNCIIEMRGYYQEIASLYNFQKYLMLHFQWNQFITTWQQKMWRNDRFRTFIFMNLASIMEKADEQLLPSVYRNVGATFSVTPDVLGMLTLSRAVMQALSSPVGGILGHYNDRIQVICLGCFIWGLMTLGFSMCQRVSWGMLFWGINGIGLAMVIPNYQSVTADYYPAQQRGKAFGTLYLTSYAGGMLGGMFGTNMAHQDVFGLTGWRVAFFFVGVFSLMVSALTYAFAKDPRDPAKLDKISKSNTSSFTMLKKLWKDVKAVIMVPTFIIIILQGIVGSFPWNALVYLTLYLQLAGMSDFMASFLNSWFLGCTAVGGLIGGFVGDLASLRFPKGGRIAVCQFSVGVGVPLSVILLNLPTNSDSSAFYSHMLILTLMGLLISWAAPACNNPIFAEIVPEDMRNIIYAFDRCFEWAIASSAAPIVGVLAHRVFGFMGTAETHPDDPALDQHNAKALGNAMLYCMVVPWSLCALVYTGLYWTYPKDKERSQMVNHSIEMASLIQDGQQEDQVSGNRTIIAD